MYLKGRQTRAQSIRLRVQCHHPIQVTQVHLSLVLLPTQLLLMCLKTSGRRLPRHPLSRWSSRRLALAVVAI